MMDWCDISQTPGLTEEFIRNNKDKVDWNSIFQNQILSEDFILEMLNECKGYFFQIIVRYQKVSEKFIRKFKEQIEWWGDIAQWQVLSKEFIKEFESKFNQERYCLENMICCQQCFTVNEIKEMVSYNQGVIVWSCIEQKRNLSENFMEAYEHRLNWNYICIYQKLSESFMRKFHHKLSWWDASQHQKMSSEFILEFKDKIHWNLVKHVDLKIIKEAKLPLDIFKTMVGIK